MKPVCLCDLAVGATARFHAARLDPEVRDLLRSLGLTSSSVLRLCKAGEPCIVQVRSTRIGLARSVASAIFVMPEPAI
jgi:Fe2+ transport system protein FeoA